jgi:hypothetical protein
VGTYTISVSWYEAVLMSEWESIRIMKWVLLQPRGVDRGYPDLIRIFSLVERMLNSKYRLR